MTPNNPARGGGIILLMIAVFVLPFVFAWYFYDHHDSLTTKTSNYGYLINPPFTLSNLKIETPLPITTNPLNVEYQNKSFNSEVPGKWLLFTINPTQCGVACQKSLYNMRQIRTATNADQNRVVTAVLNLSNPKLDSNLNTLLARDYRGTYSLVADTAQFKQVVTKSVNHNYALLEGTIYIADPKLNVILVYAPGTDPDFIYKDLHHLLQVSQIG